MLDYLVFGVSSGTLRRGRAPENPDLVLCARVPRRIPAHKRRRLWRDDAEQRSEDICRPIFWLACTSGVMVHGQRAG